MALLDEIQLQMSGDGSVGINGASGNGIWHSPDGRWSVINGKIFNPYGAQIPPEVMAAFPSATPAEAANAMDPNGPGNGEGGSDFSNILKGLMFVGGGAALAGGLGAGSGLGGWFGGAGAEAGAALPTMADAGGFIGGGVGETVAGGSGLTAAQIAEGQAFGYLDAAGNLIPGAEAAAGGAASTGAAGTASTVAGGGPTLPAWVGPAGSAAGGVAALAGAGGAGGDGTGSGYNVDGTPTGMAGGDGGGGGTGRDTSTVDGSGGTDTGGATGNPYTPVGGGFGSSITDIAKSLGIPASAITPALASLLAGYMGSEAAKSAAETQAKSAAEAIAEQRRQFDTTQANNAPFLATGTAGNARLRQLLGLDNTYTAPDSGSLLRKFSTADLNADPVYNSGLQFGLDQGTAGINARAMREGSYDSGATLKALTRFGNDYGSTKAGDSYSRYTADQGNIYNKLAGVSGAGQTAVNTVATAGANSTNAISNLTTDAGNARAAGIVGGANAWGGAATGINTAVNSANSNEILQKLLAGRGLGY